MYFVSARPEGPLLCAGMGTRPSKSYHSANVVRVGEMATVRPMYSDRLSVPVHRHRSSYLRVLIDIRW